jgi:hypothetical protein
LTPFGLDSSWLPLPLAWSLALVATSLMILMASFSLALCIVLIRSRNRILSPAHSPLSRVIGVAIMTGFSLIGPISVALVYLGASAIIRGPWPVALVGAAVTFCLTYELCELFSYARRRNHETVSDNGLGHR